MSPASRNTTTRSTARTAPKPIEVTSELKALLRRLKLGRLLDTLPERLALARSAWLVCRTSATSGFGRLYGCPEWN